MTAPSDRVGPGPLALVGSGEYLPHMAQIEAGLIEGRPPRYVQLATAAVPDGPAVVERWHRLGAEQAERIGAEAVILPVADRDDADNPDLAARVAGAGLIYLSGGHPAYLADTLRDSAVWAAIAEAWRGGAALAGCSAGAIALTSWVPALRGRGAGPTVGLGVLPRLRVIPHFDAFVARRPDLVNRFLALGDPTVTVVGIDEDTALVGGPTDWEVQGRHSAWRIRPEGREQIPVGSVFRLPPG